MRHFASARFWRCHRALPAQVRALADRNYSLLKANPNHRSLHFKQIGPLWSVRVGLHYRALATTADDELVWFWIGSHAEYDRLVAGQPDNKALQPTRRAAAGRKPKGRGHAPRG